MAVDTQHRGKMGEISREHGNALIGALRKTYGPDFAKGCADHEYLSDITATLSVAASSRPRSYSPRK
jgi:hypothetical protein